MRLALYRKYRPSKLDSVLGQETNIRIIKNAAKQNKFGHAYLFYGPRGTGKTTTARLLAKLLNCEKRQEDEEFRKLGEPCNRCKSCIDINNNASLDIIEIDAASNRGIDEIRNLKDNIKTPPIMGKYKVYIIDEAHMLTGAAFNALLKTLEEPPKYAVFILATTEYEKMPSTIISRTQRFSFKKIPRKEIIKKLDKIAKNEKISVENGVLDLIAASADGSMRDAESLLDQLSSNSGKIGLETAKKMTGRIGFETIKKLAELILKNNMKETLLYISELNDEGCNMVQLTKDLIHYLRKILSIKIDPSLEKVFKQELTEDEISQIKELAKFSKIEGNIRLIKSLIRAYSEMRYSPFISIPLEIALIENIKENQRA